MSPTAQKVAVITGGTIGIGKAIAHELIARGAAVVIAGRNQARGEAAAAELGSHALFVPTDVSQEGDIQHLLETTLARYGRLDYWINNAGIESGGEGFEGTSVDVVDDVLAINVKGVFLALKHAAPIMVGQHAGTIINLASFVGTTMPVPQAAIYGASKAAVLSLTRAAAAAYADQQVRVYAVCPWMTDTPMTDRQTNSDPATKAAYAAFLNPSKQLATPEDLARATADLLEGRTELENGGAVLVDHGSALSRITPMTVA